MLRYITFVTYVFLMAFPLERIKAQETTPTPSPPVIVILNPLPGQALQGLVTIQANLNIPGITSGEVSFKYHEDPRETWFLISELDQSSEVETIIEWDTTTLTDGDYDLRILVNTNSDQLSEHIPGLRIRNYSPIETNTPAPTASTAPEEPEEPTSTAIPTDTPIPPTPTPLPTNPAQLTNADVFYSAGRGALIALGLFALFGLYQVVRNHKRNG
jgi:hypothetical protein